MNLFDFVSFILKVRYIAPENRPSQKERIVFQPTIFRDELLVLGRVIFWGVIRKITSNDIKELA